MAHPGHSEALASEGFGDDFGQKVDLTARIREILRNYPEGTSVYKELVQNADDAGAREVRLVLDIRSHRTDRLAAPSLASLQGPALLAFNDGKFSDVDFASIQRIGDSLKRDDSKGTKTGRFGIGFNSVFHLTEVPAFISGTKVVMFDPQAAYLPSINPANPGKMIDIKTHRQLLVKYEDQFRPFQDAFKCDLINGTPFPATLFRLPLRTPEQASTSRLSKQAHVPERVQDQLITFSKETSSMLLFLKSVEKLSTWYWPSSSAVPIQMTETYLNNLTRDVCNGRTLMSRRMSSSGGKLPQQKPFDGDYVLKTRLIEKEVWPRNPEGQVGKCVEETWVICNRLGGGAAQKMAETKEYAHMRMIPWAGVAARIACEASFDSDGSSGQLSRQSQAQIKSACTPVEGLAYCFLPLPVRTGIPVHVNGFFELSSNRRDIWMGEDLVGDGKVRADWNRSLLQELIVPCYARLLETVGSIMSGGGPIYDGLWPLGTARGPWRDVEIGLYGAVKPMAVLWCGKKGGGGRWTKPTETTVVPQEGWEIIEEGGSEGKVHLHGVLKDEGLLVPDTAADVQKALLEHGCVKQVASPCFVRDHLRNNSLHHPALLSRVAIRLLLRYCLLDQTEKQFDALDGLPLLSSCQSGSLPRRIVLYKIACGSLINGLGQAGFSLGLSLQALKRHPPGPGNHIQAAIAWLQEQNARAKKAQDAFIDLGDLVFTLSDPTREVDIFRAVAHRLLDPDILPASARAILTCPHFQLTSNLRPLTTQHLPDLLRCILPFTWHSQSVVCWQNCPSAIPNLAWFRSFWSYVLATVKDLESLVNDLPLLPCNESFVVRLSNKIPLLVLSPISPLPVSLLTSLRQVGIVTLHDDLATDLSDVHRALLRPFVRPCTRNGVLDCLSLARQTNEFRTAALSFTLRLEQLLPAEARDALRALILAEPLSGLDAEHVQLIKLLPIWPTYGPATHNVSLYATLATSQPLFILDDSFSPSQAAISQGLFGSTILRTDHPAERPLLRKLGVKSLSKINWLMYHLFPSYSQADASVRTRVMLELVLMDLPSLSAKDEKFLPMLQDLEFLPNIQGKLYRCDEMYDSEVDELAHLLGQDLLPHPDFTSPEILAILRQFGLRSTLLFSDVTHIARSAESLYDREPLNGLARARILFNFLENQADRFFLSLQTRKAEDKRKTEKKASGIFARAWKVLDGSAQQAKKQRMEKEEADERQRLAMLVDLREIRWVPVIAHRPVVYMPWRELSNGATSEESLNGVLSTPQQARIKSDMWYCSALFSIIESDRVAEPMKEAFGWNSTVSPITVAQQLLAIAATFNDITDQVVGNKKQNDRQSGDSPSSPLSLTSTEFGRTIQEMRQQITSIVPIIYNMLSQSKAQSHDVRSLLFDATWVFVGDHFVPASQVAFLCQVNATPYLYSVPPDLACFATLLRSAGVRESFGPLDFVQVLQTMAIETGVKDSELSKGNAQEEKRTVRALDNHNLGLAIDLVQRISDDVMHVANWEIFAPDDAGILARSTDLVYEDAPWLAKFNRRQDLRSVHPKVSADTAHKLGVRPMRQLLMSTHSDTMDFQFGLPTEAFGQSEDLTRRLRHILELYPEGPSILSELIQNADDAGASTVRIMYNSRQYNTTRLLGQRMSAWQGPALYVQNNATFTSNDFTNIARLGQASKLDKVFSTGRFGLGFNATYHCTDLPSFVSADSLVIFDPHVRYLPGATNAAPGVKIRFADTDLLELFPDQFEPYCLFDCDLKSPYNGTLFRFPVRTPELARMSQISNSRYSDDTFKDMFGTFQANISRYLLFLRNIDRIEVYITQDDLLSSSPASDTNAANFDYTSDAIRNTTPTLLYSATRELTNAHHWRQLSVFMTGPPEHPLSKDAFQAKLSSIPSARLPRSSQIMTVSYLEGHKDFHGRALKEACQRVDEYMVLAGFVGGGSALAMAVNPANSHMKFIPFGGVAAHLYSTTSLVDQSTIAEQKQLVHRGERQGQAFCFLPLPVDSGLPIFLNGYFELASNRRTIWTGTDLSGAGKLRSDWNYALLSDVIAPLYAELVLGVSRLLASRFDSEPSPRSFYYGLFPIPENVHLDFRTVATRFFQLSASLPLLWSRLAGAGKGGSWRDCDSCMLMTEEVEAEAPMAAADEMISERNEHNRLQDVLLDRGCCIVQVPEKLLETLVAQNCCHSKVTPQLVRQMVREAKGARPPWPQVVEDAEFLLYYCSKDLKDHEMNQLGGLRLLPIADGTLGEIQIRADVANGQMENYFLAAESELPLFVNAQQVLVSPALPRGLQAMLEKPELLAVSNIVRFGAQQLGSFLFAVLPSHVANLKKVAWQSGSSGSGVGSLPDEAWISQFWNYLASPACFVTLEDKTSIEARARGISAQSKLGGVISLSDVASLCGRWPILLALAGPNRHRVLARVNANLPLIHLNQYNLPEIWMQAELLEVFTCVGLIVVDTGPLSEAAERILTLPESRVHVESLSITGFLNALGRAAGTPPEVAKTFKGVKPSGRHALRRFIGARTILDGLKAELAEREFEMRFTRERLRQLPIYETFSQPSNVYRDTAAASYTALTSPPHYLPPSDVHPSLLDVGAPTFLKSTGSSDEDLFRFLEVQSIPLASFYHHYVLGKIQVLPPDVRNAALAKMLNSLDEIRADPEHATFWRGLEQTAFLPDANDVPSLHLPKDLYDPSQSILQALLDPGAFPANDLSTFPLLPHLRLLGLRATLSLNGILVSAKSVEVLQKAGEEERAIRRGRELILYLDSHIEALLQEHAAQNDTLAAETPQSETATSARAKMRRFTSSHSSNGGGVSTSIRDNGASFMTLPATWVQELRTIAFVPIKIACPADNLPWPSRPQAPLRRPLETGPQANQWQFSSQKGIADVHVSNPLIREVLGWEDELHPEILIRQLQALAATYEANPSPRLKTTLGSVTHEIYEALQKVLLETETRRLKPAYAQVPSFLGDARWIWCGNAFYASPRVAFQTPPNSKNYLVEVPRDLAEYTPLLEALGVRETFRARDLVSALQSLNVAAAGRVLSADQVHQANDLLKALYATPPEERQDVLSDAHCLINAPAENCKLYNIKLLCFDDAPWLSSNMSKQREIVFLHREVSPHVAKSLGARSLLETLLTSECAASAIPCATPADLRKVLAPMLAQAQGKAYSVAMNRKETGPQVPSSDSEDRDKELLMHILLEGLEVADEVCCKQVQITLDESTYGTESLMYPMLAEAQGPALLIHFKDSAVNFDDIVRLLSIIRLESGPNVRPFPPTRAQRRRYSVDKDEKQIFGWFSYGHGLTSCFQLTDLVQVLSGGQFLLFDPCARYLLSPTTSQGTASDSPAEQIVPPPAPGTNQAQAKDPPTKAAPQLPDSTQSRPLARRHSLSTRHVIDFADQFAPFLKLISESDAMVNHQDPVSPDRIFDCKGTILRLPIRSRASPISSYLPASAALVPHLSQLTTSLPATLLFSLELDCVEVFVRSAAAARASQSNIALPTPELSSQIPEDNKTITTEATRISGTSSAQPVAQLLRQISKISLDSLAAEDVRKRRQELLQSREWRKSKLQQIWKPGTSPLTGTYVLKVLKETELDQVSEEWVLMDSLGYGEARAQALQQLYQNLCLCPLISIAAKLPQQVEEKQALSDQIDVGNMYSVLPTGRASGFAYHVNAPFVLLDVMLNAVTTGLSFSDVQPDADQVAQYVSRTPKQNFARCVTWNRALLDTLYKEVVPIFMNVVRDSVQRANPVKLYTFWPDAKKVPARQKQVVDASALQYRLAAGQLFLTTNGRFMKLTEAHFLDERARGGILEQFISSSFSLFNVSYGIAEQLAEANAPIREVTPQRLRRFLKERNSNIRARITAVPGLALEILCFCLADADAAQARANMRQTQSRWSELIGLPILPLDDGGVDRIPFPSKNHQDRMNGPFLATEAQKSLLPNLQNRFVTGAAAKYLNELMDISEFRAIVGVVPFSTEVLQYHLATVLPAAWRGQLRLKVNWAEVPSPLSPQWLYCFWHEVPFAQANQFGQWPLVPTHCKPSTENQEQARNLSELVACSLASSVLRLLPDQINPELKSRLAASADQAAMIHEAEDRATYTSIRKWLPNLSDQMPREQSEIHGEKSTVLHAKDICFHLKELQEFAASSYSQPQTAQLDATTSRREADSAATSTSASNSAAEPSNVAREASSEREAKDEYAQAKSDGAGTIVQTTEDERSPNATSTGTHVDVPQEEAPAPLSLPSSEERAFHIAGPERERRLVPCLELAYFAENTYSSLLVHDGREVTKAIIFGIAMFREIIHVSGLPAQDQQYFLMRLTTLTEGGATGIALNGSEIEKLKSVPIFETINGQSVDLLDGPYSVLEDDNQNVPHLRELLKLVEAAAAQLPAGCCKLLKRKAPLQDLYKDLHVQLLKQEDILPRFLVSHLSAVDETLRAQVLSILKERWLSANLESNITLVDALKEMKFVTKMNGEHAKPSELFDPRIEVLKDFLDDDTSQFPGPDFTTPDWLPILLSLGLKTKVDKEMMLSCARNIERSQASPLPYASACKAFRLMRHFAAENDLCMDRTLGRQLSTVRCVPIEPAAIQMSGPGSSSLEGSDGSSGSREDGTGNRQYGYTGPSAAKSYHLIAYAEAYPTKDRNLVWSVAPVLLFPTVPPRVAWSALGMMSPPRPEAVVEHLMNICSRSKATKSNRESQGKGGILDQWTYGDSPSKVFSTIYKYLEENWHKLLPSVRLSIKDLPCVPIAGDLVKASRLYFRLAEDLSPYLFEVPRAFGGYDMLFAELGTRQSPSTQDYIALLAELKSEGGDNALNPNELAAVIKIINLLANTLKSQSTDGEAKLTQVTKQLLSGGSLHSPDDRCVLVPMNTCLFDDASWLRGRVHAHLLRIIHPKINLETCEAFGIPRISQVVREELAPGFTPEFDERSLFTREDLNHTLHSVEFSRAFAGLLLSYPKTHTRLLETLKGNHGIADISLDRDEASILDETAALILQAVSMYTVYFVKTLNTRFIRQYMGPHRALVWEDITARSEGSLYYVHPETKSINLATSQLPSSLTPPYVLASAVIQMMGIGQEGDSLLAPLSALLASPPQEMGRLMDLLRLDARDERRIGLLRRGIPGQMLQEMDKSKIELRPLRLPTIGEIVAWQEGQVGPVRYGIVVSQSSTTSDQGQAVEENLDASANVLRRLLIRTSPNRVQAIAYSQIYCFKATSVVDTHLAAPATPAAVYNISDRSSTTSRPLGRTLPATDSAWSQACVVEKGSYLRSSKAASPALPATAPVETHQLLSAVDDILSRVNLSLDEDMRRIMERNLRLEEEVDAAHAETETIRGRATELQHRLNAIQSSMQCQICLMRDISFLFVPCGHAICAQCKDNVRGQCPFCRSPVQYVVKNYCPF